MGNTQRALPHVALKTTAQYGRCSLGPHFTDDETEAWRGNVSDPRWHSWRVAELGLEVRPVLWPRTTPPLPPAEGGGAGTSTRRPGGDAIELGTADPREAMSKCHLKRLEVE